MRSVRTGKPRPGVRGRDRSEPEALPAAFQPGEAADPRRAVRRRGHAFRAAVEKNPAFGTGYLYLAKALLDAGDLDGGRAGGEAGLASKPDAAHAAARPLRAGRRLLAAGARRRRGASVAAGKRAERDAGNQERQ